MSDKRRRLGSRSAFAAPRMGEMQPFEPPLNTEMYQSPTKVLGNVPYSGKGYISTPEKSFSSSLSNNELAELYSSCIKLATENKITQKNSWQLNLIDYMGDVLEQEATGDNPNFQAASCTLDASVKIYSCRVDSVHTDAYKVLGGLTRTEREMEEHKETEEEAVETAPTSVEPENPKKKRKVNPALVTTIESNVEALNAKKIDNIEFLVDPLFRKTSAAFDQGGVGGLLLNHLEVQQGCTLVFDSADAVDFSLNEVAIPEDTNFCIDDLVGLLAEGGDIGAITDLNICPTFSTFKFEGVVHGADLPNIQTADKNEEEPISSDEDVPHDFNFAASNEPSFSADNSTGISHTTDNNNTSWIKPELNELIAPKASLKMIGGDHWQYASNTKNSKSETKKNKKEKNPKKEFFIDFTAPPPPPEAFLPPGKSTAAIELPLSRNTKIASQRVTLRSEHSYNIANLSQLFSKSKMEVWSDRFYNSSNESESPSLPGVSDDYDDSANESAFVPEERIIELQEAEAGDLFQDYSVQREEKQENEGKKQETSGEEEIKKDNETDNGILSGENRMEGGVDGTVGRELVEEPQKVTLDLIKYAKVASKVDVKILKAIIWEELHTRFQEEGERGEVEFKEIIESVREKAQKEVGEVSVAMCFMCVLHLSNEKGLFLSQQGIEQLVVLGR